MEGKVADLDLLVLVFRECGAHGRLEHDCSVVRHVGRAGGE